MRHYSPLDYPEMCRWLHKRDKIPPKATQLPCLGLIIPEIAVGFLIRTDTSLAIIDFLITNPEANLHERGKAIDAITKGLIKEAKNLQFRGVICRSQIDTVKRKAHALGFRYLGDFASFVKEI